MHTDSERETDLVLGTKQLLGLLFLSFVLLGVFFAMGYVLGRNSVSPETARRPTEAERIPQPSGTRPSATAGEAGAETPPQAPVGSTAPQVAEQGSIPIGAAANRPAESAGAEAPAEPKSGELYVQLTAVAKPDAEMLADVLTRRGFHAVVTPASKTGLFRVLVGPAKGEAELGKLRTDLEQIGFKGIPRKIP